MTRVLDAYRPLTPHEIVTATELEWRIADMINHAVTPWLMRISRVPSWLEEGRVDFAFVDRMARHLSWQGFTPQDFTNDNGFAALKAIADAIIGSDADPTRVVIHDEIVIELPCSEWDKVARAAQHLLLKQPRRYEIARESR